MLNFEHIIEEINNVPIEKYAFDEFFGSYKTLYNVDNIHSSYNRWKEVNGRVLVGLWTDKENRGWFVYRYMNDSFEIILENEVVYSFDIESIINIIIGKN